MTDLNPSPTAPVEGHSHVFLGTGHERNERRIWAVIALCSTMMLVEIIGGTVFGSLAVVADGLHMSTHATALLIAAAAYTYARRRASDPSFAFGTGKLGDLAGFTSAIVLAMIALLIGYEAVTRLLAPVVINFEQAIAIACVGLLVNVASALLLGGGDHHDHDPGHAHGHGHAGRSHDHDHDHDHNHDHPDHHGRRLTHHHASARDNNMRAAFVHVAADAVVSVLAIVGLLAGALFGWVWMDPVMGIVGALVIANWSFGLIRDTGKVLLDMTPDRDMGVRLRRAIESDGDRLIDFHLWRLGPGHLGAILSVATEKSRGPSHYRALLDRFGKFSHVTIEVHPGGTAATQ